MRKGRLIGVGIGKRGPENGELNPHHKLTWALVEQIRELHDKGVSFAKIGKTLNISPAAAFYAGTGRTWSRR